MGFARAQPILRSYACYKFTAARACPKTSSSAIPPSRAAMASLFFSIIIMWPLPWTPTSARRMKVFCTPACVEVARGAVVVGGVIGRLRGQDQDRDVLEVRQLARRARPASSSAPDRALSGLILAHEGKLLAVLERRIVGDRHFAEAGNLGLVVVLEPVRRAEEIDVVHRRAARLDGDDRLDELRPPVRDRPAERAGLRMRSARSPGRSCRAARPSRRG